MSAGFDVRRDRRRAATHEARLVIRQGVATMTTTDIARERGGSSRTKEAELNYAIFAYAARCVMEGDLEALRQVGFQPGDMQVIDQLRLADLHALSASRAHALNVRVDRDALQWLVEHVRRRRTRDMLKLELLQLDAPSEMMTNLFGMTGRSYTASRETLGIVGGQGRPSSRLDDDGEEARLWHLWVALADPTRPQKLRHEDLWLVIGRELASGLRRAWNIIQQWSRDERSLQSFRDERLKLTDSQLAQEEAALRDRHRVHSIGIDAAAVRPQKSDGSEFAGADPVPCTHCAASIVRAPIHG